MRTNKFIRSQGSPKHLTTTTTTTTTTKTTTKTTTPTTTGGGGKLHPADKQALHALHALVDFTLYEDKGQTFCTLCQF